VKEDVPPPEGVLRVHVWDCGGGLKLRMKNLHREDAITLEMHEGPRRLSHVPAASGAKYSDGSLTFWTSGGTAILERPGSAPVHCRELRAESLMADARERGVRYRGLGNEPGWLIEVGPGSRLLYVGDYGDHRREYDDAEEAKSTGTGVQVYAAGAGPDRIEVTVTRTACNDDMSGEAFAYRMELETDGKVHRGCAAAIQ
jgi:putative lipoprotein